ncbi:beta-1,3-galactosyltransferase 5-like [Lineus longissimus]|uniref:beta-1,3-galactosyltransferase 5-like n=1 Tax=Lineus longissimus TaxID=88925 RepID=UPI002B4E5C13
MAKSCRQKITQKSLKTRWKAWLVKNRRRIVIFLSFVVLLLVSAWCVLELMEVSRTDEAVRTFLHKVACDDCFPLDLKQVHETKDRDSVCNFGPKEAGVVLLIFSKSLNHLQRHLIRHTWGGSVNPYYHHIRIFFLFGHVHGVASRRILKQEYEKHRDIVIGDFRDSYGNLTLKAIYGFSWVLKNCPDARYVMKTDDDVIINVPNLLLTIEQNDLTGTIAGDCLGPVEPVRRKSSKWYADHETYPLSNYPMFCSGTGYIMPKKVVQDIVTISKTIPFFHLDDIYIAFCITRLGYKRKSLFPFHRYRKLPILEVDYYCSCVATSHELSSKEILGLWRESNNLNVG